jgi:uncharacterized protein YbaP (TraB family)
MRSLVLIIGLLSCQLAMGQKTYLWKITSKEHNNTSYLFGTYHPIKETFFKNYPALEKALLSCGLVVTEMQIKRDSLKALFKDRPVTDDLQKTLSAKNYELTKEIFKDLAVDLGKLYPEEILSGLQNRFDMLNCEALMSKDTYFLDEYVQVFAEKNKITNYYLETLEAQQAYKKKADGPAMTWSMARLYITMILRQYEKHRRSGKSTCPALADEYVNFKFDYNLGRSCSKLNDRSKLLLVERNRKWMEVLPGLMQKQNVFIAVGLNHLAYECGLIVQLRKLGYTVEPVEM